MTPSNHQTPSPAELKAVFGDGAPVDLMAQARTAPAVTLWGEWKRYFAFLRQPSLAVSEQSAAPWRVLGRIYLLDMAAMLVLVVCASIAVAAGVYLPKTAMAEIELTWMVALLAIVAAPVLEELAFRSWLSGRPAHVFAILSLGTGILGFGLLHASAPIIGILIMIGGSVGALAALITLRDRPTFPWFIRAFPAFFWFSTLAFALVHLLNFSDGSLAILLPLVLPQFILGGMLGYVRVRIGLWSAIVLHAVHNATALGISALASGVAT